MAYTERTERQILRDLLLAFSYYDKIPMQMNLTEKTIKTHDFNVVCCNIAPWILGYDEARCQGRVHRTFPPTGTEDSNKNKEQCKGPMSSRTFQGYTQAFQPVFIYEFNRAIFYLRNHRPSLLHRSLWETAPKQITIFVKI